MDPLLQKALLLGFDFALTKLNKDELRAMTDNLSAQGKTDAEIFAILDDLSDKESAEIRAKIAAQS